MKVKRDWVDLILYYLACIGSFGFVYIIRIVLTQAFKKALEDVKDDI